MWRKLLSTALLVGALAACTEFEGKPCVVDDDCGSNGVCEVVDGQGYCRKKPDIADQCEPVCAAYDVCTTEGCKPRFSALKIKEPANGVLLNGGTISIVAELTEQYATSAEWPALVFTAKRQDGSPAGSIPTPTRNGNTYTALWTVPNLDEQVTVTAAYLEAKLSDTVTVDVDTVAPTFTISFSNPPTRFPGNPGLQAEQRDQTSGYEGAFRRDEPVTVTISSNDDSVSKVNLTVVGIGAGGVAGRTEPIITVDLQKRTSCPGGQPVCGEKVVDLSAPEMSDFRGAMRFQASGQDGAANLGTSAEVQLRVTRWKWMFEAVTAIHGTPAVGNMGTVYFGTNSNSKSGKTFGVDPVGGKKWTFDTGDVAGSPAVGAWNANEEYVYVAGRGNTSALYAIRSDGVEKQRCSYSGNFELLSAVAVGIVGSEESAVTIYNSGDGQVQVVQIRPDSTGPKCFNIVGAAIPQSIAGAVVVKDNNVFYGTSMRTITSYDLSTDLNVARQGWPQSPNNLVRGLSIVGDKVYAASGSSDDPSVGGLFSASTAGGTLASVFPVGGATSRVFNLAVGVGDLAYFGAESSSSASLYSLRLSEIVSATPVVDAVGILRGAPVAGRNGPLYTANTQGRVAAWSGGLSSPLWNVDLAQGGGGANISPTLDCLRDASGKAVTNSPLGVLYVAADTKVHAFIVDSPGMDPAAPWPKYQHDARNTGNPATPITNCRQQ
ncbi:hypothetical protein POL68_31585 [Stigmatella sp. ncwal1]|uniref:Outer membrane protein assembly factor BamB, contains PQQ-like beta-propeller repeat n=1 Tax=Stigmatella ashevillensis TaxID=2995309 RepID=A0ABT5DHA3_9BACT|nr:hypothetical protein [Stigmatella ashevillena]MDC0713047.1 hypothetical protein [Stigmatella ashevillena]